jgi:capsular exopolysaccharide synthesis family protein
MVDEQMLLHDLGPQHPKVIAAGKKIEATRDLFYQDIPEDERPKRAKKTDFLTICVEAIKHEIRSLEARIMELDQLFEDERHESRAVTAYELKNENFQKEILRTETLYQGVVKRLDELNILADYGGFKTNVISPPGIGYHVAPKLLQSLLIGAVCGAIAGFGLGYLLERNDKRFHSPEEISEYLRLPIVGHIPVIHLDSRPIGNNSKIDRSLVAFHKPKSRLAEAYRGIRTSLYFSTRGEQHKLIQLTSPNPGDGKTTLSANLAISIAQSGKRVLLVDADFRRPKLHKLFGVKPTVGMCSVLTGQTELPDAIQPTEVENLWVLTSGPRPSNPSELLTSRRFEEMLQVLREQYDFVLVDTPPILVVTDPSAVAARVDGVILTFRLTKRTRFEAHRATEQLSSVSANVLGVVVNGVGKKRGYGGYGGYGGYASRTYDGYQYTSMYGDDSARNRPYYSEDENPEPVKDRSTRARRR